MKKPPPTPPKGGEPYWMKKPPQAPPKGGELLFAIIR